MRYDVYVDHSIFFYIYRIIQDNQLDQMKELFSPISKFSKYLMSFIHDLGDSGFMIECTDEKT